MNGSAVPTSRPLRAIVILLFLWSGGRAWYEFAPLLSPTRQVLPSAAPTATADRRPRLPDPRLRLSSIDPGLPKSRVAIPNQRTVAPARPSPERSRSAHATAEPSAATPDAEPLAESISAHTEAKIDVRSRPGTRQGLSLSSWLLVRDGAVGIAPAGTLGGAQIGTRAYLPMTRGIAATARVSKPLRASGAEASVGLALRRGPVTVLLERRFALERGGRNDFSATLAAGIDGVRLPKQFRLDAYGQVGIVGRDGFADAAVRVDRPIVSHGRSEIALGGGVWGGAQPGVARIDAGPQVVVRTPVAGGSLRASAEWRQRLAGHALPASGPALTVGMDF